METTYSYRIIMPDSNNNLSSNSYSAETFPKCCLYNELFSYFIYKSCIVAYLHIGLSYKNSTEYVGILNSTYYWGNLSSSLSSRWDHDTVITNVIELLHNQSVNVHFETELRYLEPSTFCLDTKRNSVPWEKSLKTDSSWIPTYNNGSFSPPIWNITFWTGFWLSVLLMVLTFSIYVTIPELREKVKNKCLICYLALLIACMLCVVSAETEFMYLFIGQNGTYLIKHRCHSILMG